MVGHKWFISLLCLTKRVVGLRLCIVLAVDLNVIFKGSSSFGLVSSYYSCLSTHHYFFFCNLVLDSSADLLDCVDDRCMFTCCLLPF
jgi:hypothetical protein